ncbi:MAG: PBP1A family penicillin-binding protein [Pseudomonadota bacterium]
MADRRKKTAKEPPRRGAGRKAASKASTKPASAQSKRKPGPIGRIVRRIVVGTIRLIWGVAWRGAAVVALLLAAATGFYYQQLPPVADMLDGRATGSATLLDRNGSVFAWRGEQYGGALRASDVSPHLVHAVIAAEDRRYWDHIGIDPRGIARALYTNMRAGRLVQGGSTLTQQVAKNVFLNAERTLERKLKEVPMALALELKYSKDEILSIYLNRVYLGAGTYGFEAASQRYFGISARALGPAESAMLAGLLRAPSRYAPTADIEKAQGRASVIVRLMHEQGFLSDAQVFEALANPAGLSKAARARAGDAFADWVMETLPDYLARRTTEDVRIATTFDPKAQAAAEAAVAEVFTAKVKKGSKAQAAVIVLSPNGAVRAMVGGHEDKAGRFNRATQAKRQTGSAFKPIVYAAALETGVGPRSTVEDAPITIRGWSPKNYGGGFSGTVTVEDALARSLNTVAVRLSERAGRERVRRLATEMGITTPIAPGPAVALGTSEATLIDMTGVFATIRAEGRRVTPWGMDTLTLRGDDRPLLQHKTDGGAVLPGSVARQLTHMMTGVVERGTGKRARLEGWQVAGKTGTTQEARDAWFIGFTGAYTIGVWLGNDDNAPLTGVTGGGLPAEIWQAVAKRLHAGLTPVPLPMERGDGAPRAVGRAGSAENDTLVERVFQDVLRGLGAEPEPTTGSARFEGEAGNDR